MTDRYENLDELDLFEERDTADYDIPTYFETKLEQVDEMFADSEMNPTVYPAEETLYSLLTTGDVPEDREIILGLAGDLTEYVGELDEDDFDGYHGEYLSPKDAEDTVLKTDVDRTDSLPADVDLENIEFEIPTRHPHTP